MTDPVKRPRTFVVLVEDVPGVLDRVASLFRRRAYNIESLSVGHTDRAGVSHITVVMDADDRTASLVEANLYKVASVLEVKDVSNLPSVVRDLALIKVRADHKNRSEILQVAEVFRAGWWTGARRR
jgi:acetolactate synthase-1/3 small subunit